MNKINDGGPAFPDGGRAFPDGKTNEWGYATNGGMTLRDFFAAKADVDDRLDRITNEEMTRIGLPNPGRNTDAMFWLERHFEAKAILKYMEADAMLKAREE